jgi:dipeptidase E
MRPAVLPAPATMGSVPELLLLSNSTAPGCSFLGHALDVITEVLAGHRRLLFVAFASSDPDRYTQVMTEALAPAGVQVSAAHTAADPRAADAVFVGGGNSFRLLARMRALGLLGPLRDRVAAGLPYLGASAGANLACPTIGTTNDMPITDPGSLDALGLIPFQLNVHYPVAGAAAGPQAGESRLERISEFLELNGRPVLAMPEGTWLRVSGTSGAVGGTASCLLLRRGARPEEFPAGSDVSGLLV